MKHSRILITGLAIAFQLGSVNLAAGQGRGHGRGGPQGGFHGAPPAKVKPGTPHQDRGGHEGVRHRDLARQDRLAARLAENPRLSSRLQELMPPGANVTEAARGFKNTGQFVAAAHVSRNLNIPFDQLRARMVDPNNPESLGKAVQNLRPDLSREAIKKDVKRANKQAKRDLKELEAEREKS